MYLGPFRVLFEGVYLVGLLLGLSVISAAAGEMLRVLLSWPIPFATGAFMAVLAILVCFGNRVLEPFSVFWSLFFYTTFFALLLILVVQTDYRPRIESADIAVGNAVWNGLSFTAYNVPLVAILIFVARKLRTQREAVLAGALAGPIILLPGLAFLITLSAFHPEIQDVPLPINTVVGAIERPLVALVVQIGVVGALITTGAGLIHGLNERVVSRQWAQRLPNQAALRFVVAALALLTASIAAMSIGLTELVGTGYRYAAVFYILVFITPLLTIGTWRVLAQASPGPNGSPTALSRSQNLNP